MIAWLFACRAPDPTAAPSGETGADTTAVPEQPGDALLDAAVGLSHPARPRACAVSGGPAVVAWLDDREGRGDELWLQRSDGSGWLAEPERVNTDRYAGIESFDLACDARGAWFVWSDEGDVFFRGAGEDARIDDVPELVDAVGPRIATDGGRIAVAWADEAGVVWRTSDDGGATWSPIATEPGVAADAQVAVSGDVALAWADSRDGAADIYARGPVRLDTGDEPGATESFAPRICRDGPNVGVVWLDTRPGTGLVRDVYLATSPDSGASWAQVVVAQGGVSANPDCAADGATTRVVWAQRAVDASGFGVFARTYPAGEAAEDLGATSATTPVIAGPDVVWLELDGVFASGARIDGADSAKRDLDAAAWDGRILATWIDDRTGTDEVFAVIAER